MAKKQLFTPENTRIGWIGTGVMGTSMCRRLMSAGYAVSIFSRTRSKAESLIEDGAEWRDSPADVARHSDVTVSIVGYPDDVRQVHLGPTGTLEGAAAGHVLIDMTTSEPTLARELAGRAAEKEVEALDAPVSGGDIGARSGTLSIMVGGTAEVFDAARPIFEKLGQTIVYQGSAGSGQHTKMVNQTLIATNMIGVCEALLYACRAGLNLERVLQSVASGAASSWSLSNLAPRIVAGDFEPGFYVEHFIKDMGIALNEARRMNLSLPGLALAHQLYVAVQAQGGGRKGTQALQLALAKLSGVEWENRKSVAVESGAAVS